MRLNILSLLLPTFPLTLSTPIPDPPHSSPAPQTFGPRIVFSPPENYTIPRTLYARTAQLPSGALLATWENYSPQPPLVYFPIYRSLDDGYTWSQFSEVHDQVNGFGLRYQPFLYVLPESIGAFPAGTLLCAGNSIPLNLSSTHIDLYASHDEGRTWSFVSHIAAGGEALPDNGLTPIWEPFLLALNGELIVYYSDQRDPLYGQKLVHQTSRDLKQWAPPVDDVAVAPYTARPGMTTVAHLPNGKWIMTYEYGGGPGFANYSFPAYYRIADSPLQFNQSEGLPVVSQNGTHPQSSPYVVWAPVGGPSGSIVVSTGTYETIFVNKNLGAQGDWVEIGTPEGISYTRSLRVLGNDRLLLAGGGVLSGTENEVTVSVMKLE